jgi:hypothetical protein
MIRKLLFPALAIAALGGCATSYTYRGGDHQQGDYYYGDPSVDYHYGYGGYGGYGGWGYGAGWYGYPGWYGGYPGWYGPWWGSYYPYIPPYHHHHGHDHHGHGDHPDDPDPDDGGHPDRPPPPWRDLGGLKPHEPPPRRMPGRPPVMVPEVPAPGASAVDPGRPLSPQAVPVPGVPGRVATPGLPPMRITTPVETSRVDDGPRALPTHGSSGRRAGGEMRERDDRLKRTP